MIYMPKEDSYLIRRNILKYMKEGDKVLDMGSGSGILAKEALRKSSEVLCVDIDKESVDKLREEGLDVVESDLFGNVSGKFDLIIFNPPYLPEEKGDSGLDTTGGKEGYELIERFLVCVGEYLEKDGKILLLFSSLTNKKKVDEIILREGYNFELIDKKKLFFEVLYVYLIT